MTTTPTIYTQIATITTIIIKTICKNIKLATWQSAMNKFIIIAPLTTAMDEGGGKATNTDKGELFAWYDTSDNNLA